MLRTKTKTLQDKKPDTLCELTRFFAEVMNNSAGHFSLCLSFSLISVTFKPCQKEILICAAVPRYWSPDKWLFNWHCCLTGSLIVCHITQLISIPFFAFLFICRMLAGGWTGTRAAWQEIILSRCLYVLTCSEWRPAPSTCHLLLPWKTFSLPTGGWRQL